MSHSIHAEHLAFRGLRNSVDDAIEPIPANIQLNVMEAALQYLKLQWKLEMSIRLGEPAPETPVHTILGTWMREEL
jgi:hypothetical protein